ncbi:hypothetical protein [Streptomyces triculaminicus]|uniref:hypothetical protein n=1 Tax=Streptomyces triculaminicus TaxID=2816232 RepID=UPI0037A84CAB
MARALGLAECGDPRRLQRQPARRWVERERTPGHWWPYIAQVLGLLAMPETDIGKPAAAGGDSWAAYYSPGCWAHESGLILSRLGDLDAAEEHLHLALDIRGLDRRRTRAIVLADLGGVRLRQGNVDGAIATWRDFLNCADGIRPVKVQAALQDMRVRLRRYSGVPEAEELRERAARTAS